MACVWIAAGMGLASGSATAEVLGPGYSLDIGQRLYSVTHDYFATLDADGDFVIYRSNGTRGWSTGTRGSGAVKATMQRDGKFTLVNAAGQRVWSTPTRGRHRLFGIGSWGTAMVVNARRWKPRDKKAEPFVDEILMRRGKLDWQSTAFDSPAIRRGQADAKAAAKSTKRKRTPRRRSGQ